MLERRCDSLRTDLSGSSVVCRCLLSWVVVSACGRVRSTSPPLDVRSLSTTTSPLMCVSTKMAVTASCRTVESDGTHLGVPEAAFSSKHRAISCAAHCFGPPQPPRDGRYFPCPCVADHRLVSLRAGHWNRVRETGLASTLGSRLQWPRLPGPKSEDSHGCRWPKKLPGPRHCARDRRRLRLGDDCDRVAAVARRLWGYTSPRNGGHVAPRARRPASGHASGKSGENRKTEVSLAPNLRRACGWCCGRPTSISAASCGTVD